tara:strand:+ start:65 stop:1453 length:1389 start_codon:yes stop_codon:yes gene_type:complete
MDVLDKFFIKYSYKFPKGYPDMNDEQDVLLMESILENEFGIVLEAQSITDVLHETFFALAFEALMQGKSYSIPKNLKELEDQIDNAKGLSEKSTGITKSTIIDRLTKKNPSFFKDKDINKDFSPKLTPYVEDATKSAENTYKAIKKSYPGGKIDSIKRVASDEHLGVADNVAYIDGEPVFISLKYEDGQFGSLSIPKLLNLMYGEGTLEKGLLSSIYDDSEGEKALNDTLEPFIKDINDAVDNNTEGNEFNEAFKEFMKTQSKKFEVDITTPEKFNNSSLKAKGDESFDTWNSSGNLKYLYGRIHNTWVKDKDPHKKRKRDNINPAIDKFLSTKNIDKSRVADTISYLFRQDDEKFKDKDYLYVAQGGNKIIKIPSQDKIRNKVKQLDFDLGPREKDKTDYKRDILIKDDKGKLLVTIPLNFRFSAGQFRDNYDQKGTKPTFDSEAFNKFFGADGDEITVTA